MENRESKISQVQENLSKQSMKSGSEPQEPKSGWFKRAFGAVRKTASAIARSLDSMAEGINNASQTNPAFAAAVSKSALYGMQRDKTVDMPSIPKDSGRSLVFTGISAVTLSSYINEEKRKNEMGASPDPKSPQGNKPDFLSRVKDEVKQDSGSKVDLPTTDFAP